MYDLSTYIANSEIVNRWLKEQSCQFYTCNATDRDILDTFNNTDQSKQLRHYINSLCSSKDENIVAFCENLLPAYFFFSILAMIDNKLNKRVDNFQKKLSLWSNHLAEKIE